MAPNPFQAAVLAILTANNTKTPQNEKTYPQNAKIAIP